MDPTFAAAASIARSLFAEFIETVASLSEAALDWRPIPTASSVAQLAAHVASSTPFWFGVAAGVRADLMAYRQGERAAAFATAGMSSEALCQRLQDAADEVERLAEMGRPELFDKVVTWHDDDGTGPALNHAEALFRAVSHVREHLGHAQLTRDLWLIRATDRAG